MKAERCFLAVTILTVACAHIEGRAPQALPDCSLVLQILHSEAHLYGRDGRVRGSTKGSLHFDHIAEANAPNSTPVLTAWFQGSEEKELALPSVCRDSQFEVVTHSLVREARSGVVLQFSRSTQVDGLCFMGYHVDVAPLDAQFGTGYLDGVVRGHAVHAKGQWTVSDVTLGGGGDCEIERPKSPR